MSSRGGSLTLVPHGRSARLIDEDGPPVAEGDEPITDEDVVVLIDAGRR